MGLGTDTQSILEDTVTALRTRFPASLTAIDADGRPTYANPLDPSGYAVRTFDPDLFDAEHRPFVALSVLDEEREQFGSRKDWVTIYTAAVVAVSAADPVTGDQAARDNASALAHALQLVMENNDVAAISLILIDRINPPEVLGELDRHSRYAVVECRIHALLERAY